MLGASAPAPYSAAPSAERRLLTVLFCDLVGSTALAARLDPEDLRELLTAYQKRATEIVGAAGGMVARYAGDGILAYFGYPGASENDAENAVRAGLALASAARADPGSSEAPSVRVGIATGVVIVGDLLRSAAADNPSIVGETPNLAARLQALAEPGTVVIGPQTRRLTGGLFAYRDLGLQPVKGLAMPVQAWQVLKATDTTNRFAALRSRALPMVGREAELAQLLACWTEARNGAGRIAVVSGEPGIGKSRICIELLAGVRRHDPLVLSYHCSPHHVDSALYPILAQLQRATRFQGADTDAGKIENLAALFAGAGPPSADLTALVADMMALPADQRFPLPALDARRKRGVLFEGLLEGLERLARQRAVVLVVDDAHWIDPTSAELLDLLVPRIRALPVLLIVACRPGYEPGWLGEPHVRSIVLRPIPVVDAERLIRRMPGAAGLPDTTVRGIAARADGVPLFIEELTRAVLEGADPQQGPESSAAREPVPDQRPIPSSLHASLMSRLDRLGKAREVAKIAAALGREFSLDLLCVVSPDSAQATQSALDQLIGAELMTRTGPAQAQTYAFRHALIQEAAYGTSLRGERRALHERIARALEAQFPAIVSMAPEVLAGHFSKAGLLEPAIQYLQQAGNRASGRSALVEAIAHFTEGIRLARLLPPSPARAGTEFDLHMALGPAVMASKGYAAPEALEVYARASELVDEASNPAHRLQVLLGLFNVHYGRAEHAQALAAARQHLSLAERLGEQIGCSHTLLGECHSAVGAFVDARQHFTRALEIFAREPEQPQSLGVFGSQEVVSLAMIAGVHFALGETEQARAATARSIERANELQHALSIALALITSLLTPVPGGLGAEPARADEAVRFCSQHGFKNFEIWALFAQGAICARRGDPGEGARIMQAAIDAAEAMHSRLFRPVQLASVAGAHARLGQTEEALALLGEAIETAERTGERQALAALHRLHAEMLAATGGHAEAERALLRAREIAGVQQARSEAARIEGATARLPKQDQGTSRKGPLAALRALFRKQG